MGLYPRTDFSMNDQGQLVQTFDDFSGAVRTIIYVPIVEFVTRTDCFCCSCGDPEGSDPACRNHGFAAKRPCEEHGMPGSVWDDDDTMPDSVQKERARHG